MGQSGKKLVNTSVSKTHIVAMKEMNGPVIDNSSRDPF